MSGQSDAGVGDLLMLLVPVFALMVLVVLSLAVSVFLGWWRAR